MRFSAPPAAVLGIEEERVIHFAVHGEFTGGLVDLDEHQLRDVLVGPAVISGRIGPAVVAVGGQRHGKKALWRPVLEGLVLVGRFRPTPAPTAFSGVRHWSQVQVVVLSRRGRIADVEGLDACGRPIQSGAVCIGRCQPNGQQHALRHRVNVGRDTGHLQLAKDGGVGRIAQVDGPQRIDLLEGHHVRHVVGEAGRPDALAFRKATDVADLPQDLFAGLEVGRALQGHDVADHRLWVLHPPAAPLAGGGGHAHDAFVLRERELVEDGAVHAARTGVERGAGIADVEGVQVG